MLVNRYLLGEELENIDELENDTSFMIEAMRRSHDKKLYDLCGDDVINDKYFVKFLIETFNDDYDFLDEVVKDFLFAKEALRKIEVEDEIKYLEDILTVLLSMSKLEAKYHGEKGFTHAASLFVYYKMVLIEIEELYNLYGSDFYGGLTFIKDDFDGNVELIDYFAKQLFNDLLMKKNVNLAFLIKQNFKSYEEVDKGLKTFLFNFVKDYDEPLAYYLIMHENVYQEIYDFIKNSRINFNEDKIDLIFKYVSELTKEFENNEGVPSLMDDEVIFLVLRDINKLDDLKAYAMKNGFYDFVNVWIDEYAFVSKSDFDDLDMKYYNFIKSIIVNVYSKNDFKINTNKRSKIIRLSDYK